MNNLNAIKYLAVLTNNTFDIWRLAGKSRRFDRQALMSMLLGRKVPQAQAGVNAITKHLLNVNGIQSGCMAVRERELTDRLKTQLEQSA